jgi:hypothetical protein
VVLMVDMSNVKCKMVMSFLGLLKKVIPFRFYPLLPCLLNALLQMKQAQQPEILLSLIQHVMNNAT